MTDIARYHHIQPVGDGPLQLVHHVAKDVSGLTAIPSP
jgi:hypothetical protein